MRVVSWNMNYWQRRGQGQYEAAWDYLRGTVKPDVALLQEAVVPPGLDAVRRTDGIRQGQPWHSAVVVFGGTYEPVWEVQSEYRGRENKAVAIDASFPGTVAAARLDVGITVVSAYGLINNGYASTSMLRILADLEHLHDDRHGRGDKVILAGDWNIGTWWNGRDEKYRDRDMSLLGVLAGRGLVDFIDAKLPVDRGRLAECRCTFDDECRHVWTYKSARWPNVAYQDDYMYGSAALVPSIQSAEVWNDETAWALSDHAPLVVDISL
jgi:exonuclease III